ncbi:MAG: class I SAM-dependent methyltransferase [Terracidiphilus sp.]
MQELLSDKNVRAPSRSTVTTIGEYNAKGSFISDAPPLQGVRLQCPRCKASIAQLNCQFCGLEMVVQNGIINALPPDRAAHFARFIDDYEHIRSEEGRWSLQDDFYLSLPYKDLSGKNSKQWKIRARSFDYLMKHVLNRNLQQNGGRILDLGAGNCWMSYRLALANYRPVAVDLLTNDHDGMGAAEHFRKHLPSMFPRVQAELASLPIQTEQFDAVIFNASFHYAEDYVATLREALRCVKHGGVVIISDTPWYSQDESGRRMVAERIAAFFERYGTASDSIKSLEYLTDERLLTLEVRLGIRWTIHRPRYGLNWAMRPPIARLLNRREPSRFRIYAAWKV